MKRLSITLIAAVALVALGPGVASAHTVEYNTNVTIIFEPTYSPDPFHGRVKANKGACRKNRTVKVKREEGSTDPVYGTDTSDNQGNWSVDGVTPVPSGDYYAKVERLVLKKNKNHKHICKSATSPTVTVP